MERTMAKESISRLVQGLARSAMLSAFFLLLILAGTPPRAEEKPAPSLKDRVKRVPPLNLNEALKSFQTLGGFVLQPLAVEPLVLDPVAGAYDEDGNLFVVEMSDYPNPLKEGEIPKGRLRKLIDRDGDGRFDESHTVADGLFWPTGVACWKGGAYVLSAPDIWYFKDTNGDEKADVREKVATGFIIYNVQQLANNLRWGVDNRIYGITAGNGADLKSSGQDTLPLRRRDFKFDPLSKSFEAISGTGQFGLAFDDWYHRFTCSNRDPVMEVILPSRVLDRNPLLTIPSSVAYEVVEGQGNPIPVYPISPPEPWRTVRTERYLAEGQKFALSEMVASGVFTSAAGITIYRGHAYPEGYKGQAFIANPAGNLIHRRALLPAGATHQAIPADVKTEFVRSKDIWFRPVNFINAPDGTLHVLDMYREVVEHPWTIPDDIKECLDLHSGRDRGRIYRLAPPGFQTSAPAKLSQASSKELVSLLGHRGAWWRETAQRLLYERRDPQALPLIKRLAGVSLNPLARLHAIYLLDGLGELSEAEIRLALIHPEAGLREHGLILAEKSLARFPKLQEDILQLQGDPDPRVCFQLAIACGAIKDAKAALVLADILEKHLSDPWIRTACLSSGARFALPLLENLHTKKAFWESEPGRQALAQLFLNLGGGDPVEGDKALFLLAQADSKDPSQTIRFLQSFGLGRKRVSRTLMPAQNPQVAAWVKKKLALAQVMAADSRQPVDERVQATLLLAFADSGVAEKTLSNLLQPQEFKEVQVAALRALRTSGAAFVPAVLLKHWKSFTPALRSEAAEALLSRFAWTKLLLEEIKKGGISASDIDLVKRQALLKHRDKEIQTLAGELFAVNQARGQVLAKYAPSLKGGDWARGKVVYQKECAVCHKVGAEGKDIGPNLLTVGTRTPEAFLAAILDPDREVDSRYLNYVFALKGGKLVTGMVTAESAKSITVSKSDATVETLTREEVEEMVCTGKSFMPVGFEERISPAAMADLLTFLLAPR